MSEEKDTIEKLYDRLDDYDKQQLFNYGYLMEYKQNLERELENLQQRFDKIKNYLKQVHIEQQNGILSSNNLIWDNIVRLCDGLEILEDRNE